MITKVLRSLLCSHCKLLLVLLWKLAQSEAPHCPSFAVSDAAKIVAPHPSFLFSCLVPTGPPQNLVVSSHTTTSVTLTWSDPAPDRINDRDGVTGFAVKKSGVQVAIVTDRNITFTGLTPASTFTIEVLAINQQGTAPNNHAARFTVTTASGGMHTSELTPLCIFGCLHVPFPPPHPCHPMQYPTPQPYMWSSQGFPATSWCGVTRSLLRVQSLVFRSAT